MSIVMSSGASCRRAPPAVLGATVKPPASSVRWRSAQWARKVNFASNPNSRYHGTSPRNCEQEGGPSSFCGLRRKGCLERKFCKVTTVCVPGHAELPAEPLAWLIGSHLGFPVVTVQGCLVFAIGSYEYEYTTVNRSSPTLLRILQSHDCRDVVGLANPIFRYLPVWKVPRAPPGWKKKEKEKAGGDATYTATQFDNCCRMWVNLQEQKLGKPAQSIHRDIPVQYLITVRSDAACASGPCALA